MHQHVDSFHNVQRFTVDSVFMIIVSGYIVSFDEVVPMVRPVVGYWDVGLDSAECQCWDESYSIYYSE